MDEHRRFLRYSANRWSDPQSNKPHGESLIFPSRTGNPFFLGFLWPGRSPIIQRSVKSKRIHILFRYSSQIALVSREANQCFRDFNKLPSRCLWEEIAHSYRQLESYSSFGCNHLKVQFSSDFYITEIQAPVGTNWPTPKQREMIERYIYMYVRA